MQPTKKEIKKFIEVFDTLCRFEGEHRHLRGWGALDREVLPVAEVILVISWLESLTKDDENEIPGEL